MKKIFLVFLAGWVMTGCANFLEEQSQSEVIPKTAKDFGELLLGSGYPKQGGAPNFAYTSLMEDDMQMAFDRGGMTDYNVEVAGAITNSLVYQWQPKMVDIDGYNKPINTNAGSTVYGGYYSRIAGCNAVLDLIEGSIGTRAEKDRITAEALAVRAMYYFWLTNLYGRPYNSPDGRESLAVPVQLTIGLSDEPLPRSTVGHIYEEVIVPDLIKATRIFDELPVVEGNFTHMGRAAAHILLSRVYLYMERYEECIAEATKALNESDELLDMTEARFNAADGAAIWATYRFINDDNPEVMWWYGSAPAVQSQVYPVGGAQFRNIWEDKVNDRRYKVFKLGATASSVDPQFTTKWDSSNQNQAGSSIRTAEAYLNRSEAYALSDQADKAYKDYNDLRRKRIVDYTDESGLTGEALVEAVRLERRKELCFEGHRWLDLRRYGMPEISHTYKATKGGPVLEYVLEAGDPMYTLPFPSSVIANNRTTADHEGLVQNPSFFAPQRDPIQE